MAMLFSKDDFDSSIYGISISKAEELRKMNNNLFADEFNVYIYKTILDGKELPGKIQINNQTIIYVLF